MNESAIDEVPLHPEVPTNLQSLLELNLATQDLISSLISELEIILLENRALSDEAESLLQIQAMNSAAQYRGFRLPYFFDSHDKEPPPPEEKLIKKRLGVIKLPTTKKWFEKEITRFKDVVYVTVRRSLVARLLTRKGQLEERLSTGQKPEFRTMLAEVEAELQQIDELSKIDLLKKYQHERIDWLCIAATEFYGKTPRSDVELQLMWENCVWPSMALPAWDDESLLMLYRMASSSAYPDWEAVADSCQKHVLQCWRVYMTSKNSYKKRLSDDEVLLLYSRFRKRDYVSWMLIGKEMNNFSFARVMRRVDDALKVSSRRPWQLEDDVLMLLAIYLYRASNDWDKFVSCMRTSMFSRTYSQCVSRLEFLFGTTSLSEVAKRIEGAKRSRNEVRLPWKKNKDTMVPWLLSSLMLLVEKIRWNCFYSDNPTVELQNCARKVSKSLRQVLGMIKKDVALHDRLDHEIYTALAARHGPGKPAAFPCGEALMRLAQTSIEKLLLGLETEAAITGRTVNDRAKKYEALQQFNRVFEIGILPPCVATLETAQVLLDEFTRRPVQSEDATLTEWIEEQLQSSNIFGEFERHFDALFAVPLILSRVAIPAVVSGTELSESYLQYTKKRREVVFVNKRAGKKPWIKARWEKIRAEKLKLAAEKTLEEGVPNDQQSEVRIEENMEENELSED